MTRLFPFQDLWNAELDICGFFVPWWLVIGIIAFVVAWLIVTVMERTHLTEHIWHLPLFFLALFVLVYSVIGLIFSP